MGLFFALRKGFGLPESGAKYHASEVMITETLDLSYLGVFSIWNNDLGRWDSKIYRAHWLTVRQAPEKLLGGLAPLTLM